jgi:molybdopterin synthase catalytic subunit
MARRSEKPRVVEGASTRRRRRLTHAEIDTLGVTSSARDPGAGAVVLFLGTVRGEERGDVEEEEEDDGRGVEGIDYEAYEPMAEKALALAEERVKRRFKDIHEIRILHRVGSLKVGEVSVAVAVSSPHRAEAFDACRYAMELIKHGVPIWKRERLRDGRTIWVEGVPLGDGSDDRSETAEGQRYGAREDADKKLLLLPPPPPPPPGRRSQRARQGGRTAKSPLAKGRGPKNGSK